MSQMKEMKLFSVRPGGHDWSRIKSYVIVASLDETDAAREAFPKLKIDRAMWWKRHGAPESWIVWRVMTPREFRENVGMLNVHDDNVNNDESPKDVFDAFLTDRREVRL